MRVLHVRANVPDVNNTPIFGHPHTLHNGDRHGSVGVSDGYTFFGRLCMSPDDITDDLSLGFTLRRLRTLKAGVARTDTVYQAERARIDAWRARRVRRMLDEIAVLEANIERFALSRRLAGQKSVDLPDGIVRTRTVAGKVKIEDEREFIAWAEENAADLLRTVVQVDRAALAEQVKAKRFVDRDALVVDVDGQIVAGAVYVAPTVSVSIDVADGDFDDV